MGLKVPCLVHRKAVDKPLIDKHAPKQIPDPNDPERKIDNPIYGKTVEIRSAILITDNVKTQLRGDFNLKGFSEEDFAALSEGAAAEVEIG